MLVAGFLCLMAKGEREHAKWFSDRDKKEQKNVRRKKFLLKMRKLFYESVTLHQWPRHPFIHLSIFFSFVR